MKYCFIATWKMAYEGVELANARLASGDNIQKALEEAICCVENNPNFHSVGYGGLPNMNGEVELDAAFMNGRYSSFGAIMGVKGIKNPIKVAIKLSKLKRNILLCGKGAEKYAEENGFEFRNMLTEESKKRWLDKRKEEFDKEKTEAYGGHDTVCMLGYDQSKNLAVGVSTSGLFMKHPGRVGDSPVIGSGFYCDQRYGSASATGVGEDIMKGCLSYEVVRLISQGEKPQSACENALKNLLEKFESCGHQSGSISLIACDIKGNYGAATSKAEFPYVIINSNQRLCLMVATKLSLNKPPFEANDEWLKSYKGD